MNFLSSINLPWSHVRSHTKFGLAGLTFIEYEQIDSQAKYMCIY